MNKFARLVRQNRLALSAAVLGASGFANAALPDGAATAITGYQTDVLAALALVIAAGIAIYGVKKLGSKMGWL